MDEIFSPYEEATLLMRDFTKYTDTRVSIKMRETHTHTRKEKKDPKAIKTYSSSALFLSPSLSLVLPHYIHPYYKKLALYFYHFYFFILMMILLCVCQSKKK